MLALSVMAAHLWMAQADNSPHWAMAWVDRTVLIAFDINPLKLGISGAQSSMLTIVADPEMGKPTVILTRFEFDCFARKARVTGGISEFPMRTPTIHNETSDWETMPAGSSLDQASKIACAKNPSIPEKWVALTLSSDQIIEFYFPKY